jgi:hypothetical protein
LTFEAVGKKIFWLAIRTVSYVLSKKTLATAGICMYSISDDDAYYIILGNNNQQLQAERQVAVHLAISPDGARCRTASLPLARYNSPPSALSPNPP